ncbi:4-(cytidine 5'-diphospho)-2-C-methyl-D-erythritol kinase [Aeromicrobium sp. SMF47]|uniref:4-diphosphocytidyl-2-C-methyl-D-erythritol kinase n=1 Tax=Aeromicrobium yanjiei TaxID=2662028 RepID=A0A5Q2MGV7_9ACTN|nr:MULTISPECIES: 4-(cytidine 5'-diphospho)-2-C-methyl-D-erythritol kinase [Aeromicrobium]MRJ76447.1 4-(cytidine 5'-diphospho)-2-C-methyl-D-erythritol kinase [Aeromicrobium yanjiei]MRK00798.1 4-(cytidine 5'-diphospho)-2-C-methyl-D-erythritol kinase [Aeromicrobium sp. S22]QGG42384.1 4-(cytidine 5'-diphospho)-2-C-methyl-D-erythritol kinase [Aeromicrobium yanjiei]
MSSANVRVPAKINLCLGVGPVRDDGYHPLATVYQAVDLHDEVRATSRADGEIRVSVQSELDVRSEIAFVPEDDDNLAVRAARLLRERTGVPFGADLAIRKVIPVAGGMAGGSADAAASLVACNEAWGTGLSRAALEQLAAQLGSDVPFLLHGGNAIGGGRGETISPVLARGTYHWVFAMAHEGLSTAAVYAEFDRLNAGATVPDPVVPDALLAALRAGDAHALGGALSNDLTEAALSLRPELEDTLSIGIEAGALGAILSGSGPTALFLASDEQHGLDIAFALSSAAACADVVQSRGPVHGARLT